MNRELKETGITYLKKVPTNWNLYRIKNGFNCSKQVVGEAWNETQLLSLTTKGVKEKDIDNPNGKLPESFETYQIVNKNDLIMCLFDLDCSAVFSGISNYSGMISPAYKVLDCKSIMNPRYAGYYFNYIGYDRKYMHYSKNIRFTLSFEEFGALPMLFPPLDEQERIANYLDDKCSKIDKAIEDNKKQIELIEEYKISNIYHSIFKGYSYNDKDNMIRLRFLARLKTGTTPKDFEKAENENKVDWFTPSDFTSLELDNSLRKLDSDVAKDIDLFPQNSTLIIGIGGTLGKIGYLIKDAYSNQQITAIIPNENINKKYITYSIIAISKYIKDTCPYTTLPILSNSFLKNVNIPNLSIEEQNRVAEKLDKQEEEFKKLISVRKQIINKLEEYKKSLIYEVVTGKKEV